LLHKDAGDVDLGHRSLQCGRRNDALKLWLAWKERGDEGWSKQVDRYIADADYMEEQVHAHPRLEMMSTRKYANVCMRYNPTPGVDDDKLNDLNAKIRQALQDTGRFMISRSNIGKHVILRPVTSHPGLTRKVLDDLLAEIVKIGDSLQ